MGLRDKAWSPYAAGILIGLLRAPAFMLTEGCFAAGICKNARMPQKP